MAPPPGGEGDLQVKHTACHVRGQDMASLMLESAFMIKACEGLWPMVHQGAWITAHVGLSCFTPIAAGRHLGSLSPRVLIPRSEPQTSNPPPESALVPLRPTLGDLSELRRRARGGSHGGPGVAQPLLRPSAGSSQLRLFSLN